MTNVIKLGKKTFTWSVVLMTILWSVGAAALVPLVANAQVGYTPVAGDYVKVNGESTVYLLVNDGGVLKTMYIPHEKVVKTWAGAEYVNSVHSLGAVNPYESAMNPAGLNFRPGDRLIKKVDNPAVYAVLSGNMRAKIANADVAAALYGANWYTRVSDVHPFWWVNLTDTTEISSAVPHNGMVVSQGGNNYFVVDGEYKMVDGTLPSYVVPQAVSAGVFATLSNSGETVTAASVTSNPGQRTGASTPVPVGSVSVALSPATPASGYVYKNSTHNAFTKVVFTNTSASAVTIDSFVVQRTGAPATDAAFTGVNVLLDSGALLNESYKTLNSDHQATFTNDVVVPANSSVTLTLVGKMANVNTYAGESPTLSLVSVNTSAAVSGSLPITGNPMTINTTVVVGVATVTESPDLGTLTEEVGTTDVEFLNVKVSNDSSNNIGLLVKSLRFNNAGSADDTDVENMELVIDGTVVATAKMVNNYVYFDLTAVAKANLENGKNETFTLRGDIVGGSGRTLDFDVKVADDIFAYDKLNGAYVTPSASIDSGRTVTISRGTLNISKTNDVQASNIPEDTTDLKFGSWNFKVAGEPVTISSLAFDINVNGTVQAADFTQLKLVNAAGTSLTGTFDGVGAGDGSVTTTDSFTLAEGDHVLTLMGKLNADGAVNDWVEFSIDQSYEAGLQATGDVTGDAITSATSPAYSFPASRITANRQTITSGALSVTTLSSVPAQTVAAGATGHHFATVALNGTASSEDVKISTFQINVTTTAGETNQVQNITFKVNDTADGTYRTLGTVKHGSLATAGTDERISVSLPTADHIVVGKGKTVYMQIYADISASTSANDKFQIYIGSTANDAGDTTTLTAEGVLTGNTITVAYDSASGNAMTVGTAGGHLEVSLFSGNPSAALMAADTDVTLAAFRFLATTTEDVELDYLYLTQVVTDTASSSFNDYDFIWFEDASGNEIAGTRMSPTSTVPYIDFADDAFVVEADGSAEVLYLKASLAAIGSCASLTCTGENGTPGHQLGYKITTASTDVVAKGVNSGSATTEFAGTVVPTGNTHFVYKSYPSVSVGSVSATLANGTRDLFKFTVSAVNGDVGLGGFTFDISTTTARLVAGTLYVYDVTESQEKQVNLTGGTGVYYGTGAVWQTVGHANDWDVSGGAATNDQVTVTPGTPRTFVVRANVTGATTGSSISTGLAGDGAGLSAVTTIMLSAANVDSQVDDDFIWSDMSDNGHSDATLDWVNGHLVPGLNSSTSTLSTVAL